MRHNDVTLLVCEDDALYQKTLSVLLGAGFRVVFTQDGDALMAQVAELAPDIVLLDLCLQTENAGFDLLKRLRARWSDLPVVIHSGMDDYQSVVRAMRLGATDYIPKHCAQDRIATQLRQLARQRQRAGTVELTKTCHMVGESKAMAQLRDMVRRIQNFPGNVIVSGESGVGKELVARALQREGAPFITVDASTIAASTAESTLFGHERGAFTGAERARRGLLEEADGGVLFIDEVANMSLEVQAKLLRALQEKEVVRLGASNVRSLEFRVVCATNRDLPALCDKGDFRHDLYARLNVFTLHVPPLRLREGDIPLLVNHFIQMYADIPPEIDPEVMELLMAHDWPGNVRELSNAVQYMLAMSEGGAVLPCHLPAKIDACAFFGAPSDGCAAERKSGSFVARMLAYERELLRREYDLANGNVSRMARDLQMDRSNLHAKLKEYKIHMKGRRTVR